MWCMPVFGANKLHCSVDAQVADAASETAQRQQDQQHAVNHDSKTGTQRNLRHRSAYPEPKSSPHPDCKLSDNILQKHRCYTHQQQQQQKQQQCEAWCDAIHAEKSMSSSTHSFSFQSIRQYLGRSSVRRSSSISSSTMISSSWFQSACNNA